MGNIRKHLLNVCLLSINYHCVIFPMKFNQLKRQLLLIIIIASQHNELTRHMLAVQKFAGLNMVRRCSSIYSQSFFTSYFSVNRGTNSCPSGRTKPCNCLLPHLSPI